MRDEDVIRASRRLLRPYVIPDDCPYLSEDQRELSTLTIEGRSAWMAEWLALAQGVQQGRIPLARSRGGRAPRGAGRLHAEGPDRAQP